MSLLVFCSLRSILEGKFPQHFSLFAQNVVSQLCVRAFEGNYNSALRLHYFHYGYSFPVWSTHNSRKNRSSFLSCGT